MELEAGATTNENKSNQQSSKEVLKSSCIVMKYQELNSPAKPVTTVYNVKLICVLLLITFLIGIIVLCYSIIKFVYQYQETQVKETLGIDEGLVK